MSNPYPELSPDLRSASAVQSLTYDQMRRVANCLWHLFSARDRMLNVHSDDLGNEAARIAVDQGVAALLECSDDDEKACQTVHDAFVNCILSLEAVHKVQGGN